MQPGVGVSSGQRLIRHRCGTKGLPQVIESYRLLIVATHIAKQSEQFGQHLLVDTLYVLLHAVADALLEMFVGPARLATPITGPSKRPRSTM